MGCGGIPLMQSSGDHPCWNLTEDEISVPSAIKVSAKSDMGRACGLFLLLS